MENPDDLKTQMKSVPLEDSPEILQENGSALSSGSAPVENIGLEKEPIQDSEELEEQSLLQKKETDESDSEKDALRIENPLKNEVLQKNENSAAQTAEEKNAARSTDHSGSQADLSDDRKLPEEIPFPPAEEKSLLEKVISDEINNP